MEELIRKHNKSKIFYGIANFLWAIALMHFIVVLFIIVLFLLSPFDFTETIIYSYCISTLFTIIGIVTTKGEYSPGYDSHDLGFDAETGGANAILVRAEKVTGSVQLISSIIFGSSESILKGMAHIKQILKFQQHDLMEAKRIFNFLKSQSGSSKFHSVEDLKPDQSVLRKLIHAEFIKFKYNDDQVVFAINAYNQ